MISRGISIEREDLNTSHKESILIMVQQSFQKVFNHQIDIVFAKCDKANVLILLTYFCWKKDLSRTMYIPGTSTERSNEDIIPLIVAVHPL